MSLPVSINGVKTTAMYLPFVVMRSPAGVVDGASLPQGAAAGKLRHPTVTAPQMPKGGVVLGEVDEGVAAVPELHLPSLS